MDPVIRSLYERKSVRVFTGEKISEEHVRVIAQAAAQAPTAGNQQLYTMIRVTDPDKKHALSISCDHQPFIEEADLVLVFCADCLRWYRAYEEAGIEPRKPGEGDLMIAVSDALIAAQNAVTAAQALGIGSCYIGDILENAEVQKKILGLPAYVFPAAMVVFGYPTDQQKERPKPARLDLDFVLQENTYHEHTGEELRKMFEGRTGVMTYEAWMKAFYERKYNSDFAREMTRSVRKLLEDYREG